MLVVEFAALFAVLDLLLDDGIVIMAGAEIALCYCLFTAPVDNALINILLHTDLKITNLIYLYLTA